jgi:uridine kinase
VSSPGREVVDRLASALSTIDLGRPLRVAVDGPDAAGKTTLADEIAALLGRRGRSAHRVSIDGFLRPRLERDADTVATPEGYYRGAFDTETFLSGVLEPLRPDGDWLIRVVSYDYSADRRTVLEPSRLERDAIVLIDGVFLQRPEFGREWDVVVYLDVTPDETLRRACERDAELFGGAAETESRYRNRYLPAQLMYRAEVDPIARAHVVIDNEDPESPRVSRWELA